MLSWFKRKPNKAPVEPRTWAEYRRAKVRRTVDDMRRAQNLPAIDWSEFTELTE